MTLLFGTLLITIRLASMMLVAPILGSQTIPLYIKASLATLVSLAIAPIILANPETNQTMIQELPGLIVGMANEAVVGILIGLGILIIFSAALMIGSAMGQLSGLQLDSFLSSSEFGRQPATQLVGITAAVAFACSGGLELMLSSVIESFGAIPVGGSLDTTRILTTLTTLLQQSFELTIRAVAPAIATLLISTIVVGILSRTLPQLNLIQVGLSSNMALMMLALILTLSGCVWLVVDNIEQASSFINQSISIER